MSKELYRWNYKEQAYEPYSVPEDWKTPLYCANTEATINCATCGKSIKYSEGNSSIELRRYTGLSYTVCDDCYAKEQKRDRHYRRTGRPCPED